MSKNKKKPTGELPKKIVASHMGYVIDNKPVSLMQTGGSETPPAVKGPALSRPPKMPPKPRQAPPV